MPDIFLSYSREDQPTARRYAEAFERAGLSVWWDQSLNTGEAYDEVTESALREARAVVVLWSKKSVVSRWVRAEATQADRARTLVPVMIEACTRPIMFELTQTADLSHWQGDDRDPAWKALLSSIARVKAGSQRQASPVVPATPTGRGASGRKLLAAIAAAVVLLAVGGGWLMGRGKPTGVESGIAEAAAAPAPAVVSASLAVLPFANLSPDPAQEFFSDGLTEELLNQLAQVSSLRVIGRTSSFAFKGRKEDLPTIGRLLGVNHILDGSVRKDGKRLRITATLMKSADGSQLWSESYERTLNDVFAIQEEIARTVTARLQLKIGDLGLTPSGTRNVAAYEELLAGRALLNTTSPTSILAAVPRLERAVALDPAYTDAWLWLADALWRAVLSNPPDYTSIIRRQDEVIDQIVELRPGASAAAFALSYRSARNGKLQQLEHQLQESLLLSGSLGARARVRYAQFLGGLGQQSRLIAELERARLHDPLDMFVRNNLLMAYGVSERANEEIRQLRKLPNGDSVVLTSAIVRAQSSKDKVSLQDALKASPQTEIGRSSFNALLLLDDPVEAKAQLRQLMGVIKDSADIYALGRIAQWSAYFGDNALALDALQAMTRRSLTLESWGIIWRPVLREVRAAAGFKSVVRDLGLVDYWRATNQWGDYCRPIGADDFECK